MGNPVVATALIGALAAAATAMVTWAIAKRTTSGTVDTSTAAELWTQNNRFVDALLADNGMLRTLLHTRDGEIETTRERLHVLEQKAHLSELAESECNDRADKLSIRVAELEKALKLDSPKERVVVSGEHLEARGPDPAGI